MTPPSAGRSYFAFPAIAGQVPALDGLRALAIILVMARHGLRAEGHAPALMIGGWDALAPLVNGWVGVDLFFVLSGYLIAGSLMRDGAPGIGAYVVNRALRILPAYYAVLLIVAFGLVPFYPVSDTGLGLRIAYHLLFLQDYLPANFVVVFWSLGVEEKFYLLAPLIVLPLCAIRGRGRAFAILIALIVLAPGLRAITAAALPGIADYPAFFQAFRSPFHASMDALLIGVLAAWLVHDRTLAATAGRHAGWIFWVGTAGFVTLIAPVEMLAQITLYDKLAQSTLVALACGAMVLGAALGGGPVRALSATWLRVTARLSYCLYLVHLALVPLAARIGEVIFPTLPPGTTAQFAAFFCVYVLLSLAAALALHYLVEKPGLLLKSSLSKRKDQAPSGRGYPPAPAPAAG